MTTFARIIESFSLAIRGTVQSTRSAHKYIAVLGAAAVVAQPVAMASDYWLWREQIQAPSASPVALSPAARPAAPTDDWLWHEQVPAAQAKPLYVTRTTDRDRTLDSALWREQIKHDRAFVIPATGAAEIVVPAATSTSDPSKYSLKVPGGLAFSEFRGYEDWAAVTVERTEELLKMVLANPVAIDAYRAGVPGNGEPFPDGSKIAKVEWKPKTSPDAPYDIAVPGAIYDLDFMVKDAKRFPDGGGWGYAVFKHDPESGTYMPATLTHKPPQGNDARCGVACHTIVQGKDFVFTEYAKR